MSTKKPWEHAKQGGSESDELAARFVESLSIDTRLYRQDIAGSIAHARMLARAGLLSAEELDAIEKGLEQIGREIDRQGENWPGWKVELEDVHMCIEAALIEKIGQPGRKLHTGRSRNDQVAADLALWIDQAVEQVGSAVGGFQQALLALAERQGRLVMPAYTHLQRAQPIVLGGELLAWCSAMQTARERFEYVRQTARRSFALGCGAIAGSALPLDRHSTCQALGMDQPAGNSIHATASRDMVIDLVYALAMTAMWLSRWAEQWIIYMTEEFGFLRLGPAYTTGSSMMPQKRNPDMLELIRGRCGGVYGHLVALLTVCKGLTVGYNRDLQEDKRHLFGAYDTVMDCLAMAARIVQSARFDEQRISASLNRGYLDATSLAEYLVTKGVPFRTAHQHVGTLVRHCIEQGLEQLADLSVEQMNQVAGCQAIGPDVYDWLGAGNVVKRYQTGGNAGLGGLDEQLTRWREKLAGR